MSHGEVGHEWADQLLRMYGLVYFLGRTSPVMSPPLERQSGTSDWLLPCRLSSLPGIGCPSGASRRFADWRMRIHVSGNAITSVDDWFRLAPPKGGEGQWREGRSALELARACCPTPGAACLPTEVQALLRTHPLTHSPAFADAMGTPELRVPLDAYKGEPRNADLALTYRAGDPPGPLVAVSIEAKADEAFGQRVSAVIAAAERRRALGERSNGDRRARELADALVGSGAGHDSDVATLRYQLLTASAGALAYARSAGATVAVLVILEFVDRREQHTSPRRLRANARDLDAFVKWLSHGAIPGVQEGVLTGPFSVPGNDYVPSGVPLLLGKVRRVLS